MFGLLFIGYLQNIGKKNVEGKRALRHVTPACLNGLMQEKKPEPVQPC